jgi:cytochrome oxidase assembly protein ShyY1
VADRVLGDATAHPPAGVGGDDVEVRRARDDGYRGGVLALLRTPRWIGLSVTALIIIVAFGALSWWQWQRAQRDRVESVPVPAASVLTTGSPLADAAYGTRVETAGVYDGSAQVLVALGPSSYWIVTPLRPGSGPAIPVARGTVSSTDDPAVSAVPTGTVRVIGVAQPFEGDPGTPSTLPSGQAERITASAFETTYPLTQGWIALQSADPPPVGVAPVIAPLSADSTASIRLQNASYAVQWVIFAGFVVFFWVRMLRYDLREVTTAPPAPASAPVREIY